MSKGTVYLIHFDSKFHHAQHYIGWTLYFKKRLEHHRRGTGAKILAAIIKAGITFRVARKWENADGHFERKLKKQKKSRLLCPICKEEVTE